jgi:hypothetical protein
MRAVPIATVIIALALSGSVVSAEDKTGSSSAEAPTARDRHMAEMQANMQIMQQQMQKLRATTDPEERQKLQQEHLQTMQANMSLMRGMGGPMMMGGGHQGGMSMMGGTRGTTGDMTQRHDMMERRMDMLQMMMEQMLQREQLMQPAPAK